MVMEKPAESFFKKYWLTVLIAAQPLLDIIAYWTKSPDGTAAGLIRFALMLILPLYLLIRLKDKRRFIALMSVMGLFCVLHVLNCFRVGYINIRFDLVYLAKTLQVPLLGICFSFLIKDEQTKEQAIRGIMAAALILLASILLAIISGTANNTYGPGLGISGWVIDDNRCANSVILVSFATAALYFAVKSENKLVTVLLPPFTAFMLILNGTKACYYSIFALCVGFAAFLVIDALLHRVRLRKAVIAVLMLTAIISAAVYPITPRCKVSQSQANGAQLVKDELELIMEELGYDIRSMTDEEKLADPVVVTTFGDYYYKIMWSIIPDMFDRFSYEEILTQYKWTTDARKLISTRLMKRSYAGLIWNEKDLITKLVGYEVSDPWFSGSSELENDWPALYYYYGYIGCALYVAYILYIIFRIIRSILLDFKGTLVLENFFLLMEFALHMGLAEFSGAVLRRPNVSIYVALVIGLIYYKTSLNKGTVLKERKAK